jgi:hypothetical protein
MFFRHSCFVGSANRVSLFGARRLLTRLFGAPGGNGCAPQAIGEFCFGGLGVISPNRWFGEP